MRHGVRESLRGAHRLVVGLRSGGGWGDSRGPGVPQGGRGGLGGKAGPDHWRGGVVAPCGLRVDLPDLRASEGRGDWCAQSLLNASFKNLWYFSTRDHLSLILPQYSVKEFNEPEIIAFPIFVFLIFFFLFFFFNVSMGEYNVRSVVSKCVAKKLVL